MLPAQEPAEGTGACDEPPTPLSWKKCCSPPSWDCTKHLLSGRFRPEETNCLEQNFLCCSEWSIFQRGCLLHTHWWVSNTRNKISVFHAVPDLDLPYSRNWICFWYHRSKISLSEIPYLRASRQRGQQSCSFKPHLYFVPIKDIRIFLFSLVLLMLYCGLERSFIPTKSSIIDTGFVPAAASAQGPSCRIKVLLRLTPRTGSS